MTFMEFARVNGLVIRHLKASEKIQRCPTEAHPRSDNGAFLWDGQRGGVMAWDGPPGWQWWRDENARPLTESDKLAWAMQRRQALAEREREYRAAATQADMVLRACNQQVHGYLLQKGFRDALGMVDSDDTLHIPMRDVLTNHLRGTQRISWENESWQKKMTSGMKAKGAALRMGAPRAREIWLVEGYATGLSVKAALSAFNANAAVLVCFSDSNLTHVATLTSGTRFVFADNDKSGAGERAAIASELPFCMSPNLGDDANDLHQSAGIFALNELMMRLRQEQHAAA